MGQYAYYCEIRRDRSDYRAGVYKVVADRGVNHLWYPQLNRLVTASDWVWNQGPRGGIKIIKAPWPKMWPMGYVTQDSDWMQQFAWVKLQAKDI